jgi:hypothetical protein
MDHKQPILITVIEQSVSGPYFNTHLQAVDK